MPDTHWLMPFFCGADDMCGSGNAICPVIFEANESGSMTVLRFDFDDERLNGANYRLPIHTRCDAFMKANS